jgi:hypothetical protein
MTKTPKKSRTAPSSASQSGQPQGEGKPTALALPAEMSVAAPKALTKQQQLAALVVRDEGATLHQMIAVTGWLPHTTRAALTGLKKKGYVISSDKVEGFAPTARLRRNEHARPSRRT